MFEVSSGALISDNAMGEGLVQHGPGLGCRDLMSSSANAEIANKTLAWIADGISVVSQNRADAAAVTGYYVHENIVVLAPQPSDTSDKSLLSGHQD
jgi:hypothetical protein